MRVFQDLAANEGEQTLPKGLTAIFERAQDLRLLSRRWSLAELQLDEDDFAWLCDWAHNLSGITVQRWLELRPWYAFRVGDRECAFSTALGAMLLLFTAESARRKATEGFLWSIFQHDCFPASTTRILYVAGQPTRVHKDALEAAARWLNLRHVFGIEGLQNWFDTVYLQFGFTSRGFQRRLPEWLVGQGRTQSIQRLLDGPMKSDTFGALWENLRNFRRRNIKAEPITSRLANNPWILPEWLDDLLQQATARIELGEGAETARPEADDVIEPFITEPILRWEHPNAPAFLCSVVNLAQFDLTEPLYYVMINTRVYTPLQRSPDGIYVFYPSEEIVLPATSPILLATLISSTGQVISSTTLTLWDTNEDLTIFRATTGKRIDIWKDIMRTETTYFLITAPDLTLVPAQKYYYKLDRQGTTLTSIDAAWPASFHIDLIGQPFWQPNSKSAPKSEEPDWAEEINIALYDTADQLTFGDTFQAMIEHPEDIEITFLRLNSRPIDFIVRDETTAITEQIAITPESLIHDAHLAELNFTIGVRRGASPERITRALGVEIVGATMLSAEGWTALLPNMTLTVEQAKTFPVQIFRSHLRRWALLEGDSWIGRPRPLARPLGSLAGLGAPINLRLGPYNALDPDVPLVREVINRGIIADVKMDHGNDGMAYTIQLNYPIELDERHEVIIWDENGQLHIRNEDCFLVQVRNSPSWVLELPASAARPLVIALAYDGIRLGAWWERNWNKILRKRQTQDIQTIAALLRWFQLPLLATQYLGALQELMQRFGHDILPIWLSETPTQEGLRWDANDEQWLSAIRAIYASWQPKDMAARRLVTKLGGNDEHLEEPMFLAAWKLLRVDPLLMGRVIRCYIENVYLPQFGPSATQQLLRTFMTTLAECNNANEIYRQENILLPTIAETMGNIDLNFVRRALVEPALDMFQGKTITPVDADNVALALSIEPFRRLLGIKVLDTIAKSLTARRK